MGAGISAKKNSVSETPTEQFNSLEEALEKSNELSDELRLIVNFMVAVRLGEVEKQPTRKEWDDLCRRAQEIMNQRNSVYQEMNRLSNGAIQINEYGTRLTNRKR